VRETTMGAGEVERDGEGCAKWIGCEKRENPTWVTEPPMPSMPLAMGYQLGTIF
jgi:hypothetical protein